MKSFGFNLLLFVSAIALDNLLQASGESNNIELTANPTNEGTDPPLLRKRSNTNTKTNSRNQSSSSSLPSPALSTATSTDSSPLKFYLHVGPTKTGSKTIQMHLRDDKELLQQDNWVFYRFNPDTAELVNCLYQHHYDCREQYVDNFRRFLSKSASKRNNIIVSWESMYHRLKDGVPSFRQLVEPFNYQLTVLVVYRRLHAWLHSRYFQDHRFSCPHIVNKRWQEKAKQERLAPIPPISQYLTNETYIWTEQGHPTEDALRDGMIFAGHVIVFNLHHGDTGDFMKRFYCTLLKAEVTCIAYRTANVTEELANVGYTLFYDRMAQQAINSGHVSTLNCTELVTQIRHFQSSLNRTPYNLPLICPPNQVFEALINTTIRSEEELLPEKERAPDSIRDEMEEIKPKFCDADMDTLLQDSEWQSFFNGL